MKNLLPPKARNIREVYLDHAATTPIDGAVLASMQLYLKKEYGNPSSLHKKGIIAQKALNQSRKSIANRLGTQTETIFFTGSGTESCNLAILGIARAHADKGKHIITSTIEHHSVLEPLKHLEKEGFTITYIKVNKEGIISVEDIKKALRKDTILVSIMFANNEIGSLQPIAEIGKEILKWRKEHKNSLPYFHTDACQATMTHELKVESLHTDLLTINASKVYGPKGIGLLYKRKNINIQPIMFGGGQEKSIRPGTENVPGIIGFAHALKINEVLKEKKVHTIKTIRDYFWKSLQEKVPNVLLNGPSFELEKRLVTNLSVSFSGVEADKLILYLDAYGIYCSAGSACTAVKTEVSHVLNACGYDDEHAINSVRFTLGKDTEKKDIDYVMKYLPKIVEVLRPSTE